MGNHPWFPAGGAATSEVRWGGILLGINGPAGGGYPPAPQNPLDPVIESDTGHGTFIAGLIRQLCPQAEVLAIPVMRGDGVVPESVLLNTLTLLLARHVEALATGSTDGLVDVLSLSLGYYHESPADAAMDAPLGALLRDFGDHGVAVIAAAGNSSTLAPMFPAGLSADVTGFSPDSVPLASVGALNPDGETVAFYSNDGDWVSTFRTGSSLVSTFPVDVTASAQASARVDFAGRARTTQDPDDYRGGFAAWSGTSFAGPVLAGEVAAALARDADLATVDKAAAVARGRRAMFGQVTEWKGKE